MRHENASDAELIRKAEGLLVDFNTRGLLDEIVARWKKAADRVAEIDKADYDFAHHEDDGEFDAGSDVSAEPQETFR